MMKRLFILKMLILLIFILIQFYPQNCLLANQKTNPVLNVLPGKAVSQQLILSGRKTEIVNFVVNAAGKLEIKAEWTGNAKTLILILYKPGYIQAVRKEGRSPIIVEFNATADMISQNNTWRVSLANFTSKTSATGSISIFQEGVSKPQSPTLINDVTKIKDYQLMEKPEKDLNAMDSETEVVEHKPEQDEQEGQIEIEDDLAGKTTSETDLELSRKRIDNLRKASSIFKKVAMEPVPDSLNQEEKAEVEKYNKWLLDKSEEMTTMADKGEKELNNISGSEDMQDFHEKFEIKYLQLQNKMQHENRQFTMLSNIMKNKHDTAKNSINNIR
jgi:hypothetical protein